MEEQQKNAAAINENIKEPKQRFLGINAPKDHPDHTEPKHVDMPGKFISRLKPEHYAVMQYKLDGLTMKQISEKSGYCLDYLQKLFYTANIFRDEWEELKESRIQAARDRLAGVALNAAGTLADLLTSPSDMAQLGAAKTILDRVGIGERQIISADINSTNLNMATDEEMAKKIMEDPNASRAAHNFLAALSGVGTSESKSRGVRIPDEQQEMDTEEAPTDNQ